jgi:hypothetical protein
LEQLVSRDDMAALARATQYAHYTPEFMIRAIWQAVQAMGFAGGTVLEPGCGTGLLLAMMPEGVVAKTAITAIEMDPSTARIAKLLYPETWVRQEDFTKATLTETYDLAIGKGADGILTRHARIIRQMIPVRDALRDVLRAEVENQPWGAAQMRLGAAYGSFVRAFKPINLTTTSRGSDAATGAVTETQRRPNLAPFADDPDCWLVASIEDYDLETGSAKKGPVFRERVIHPSADPVIITAAAALAVTLAEIGRVDRHLPLRHVGCTALTQTNAPSSPQQPRHRRRCMLPGKVISSARGAIPGCAARSPCVTRRTSAVG